ARPAPATPTPPIPLPPPPAPPPPQPAQAAGTGQTPPVQRPQENSRAVENTLERLRAQQAQQQPPTGRPNPQAGRPASGGGTPTGTAQLTQGEIRGIAEHVAQCWSVDPGMLNLQEREIIVRVRIRPPGVIYDVIPQGGPPSDPRDRALLESARRALRDPRCEALPINADRIPAVEATPFRFRPQGFIR
ncbi:MAG: hypothetical protein O9325_18350, partial [Roseomonas sp.]|nr:hypothetical protein [Roseomonas sp.]